MEIVLELSVMTFVFLSVLGVLTYLIYRRSVTNYDCWEKLGIPYIPSYPFIGSALEYLRKPLYDLEVERYKKYGTLYGYFEGRKPVLTVADPRHVRDILVKDFQFFTDRMSNNTGGAMVNKMLVSLKGESWKRMRSIITPTFTIGKIKQMTEIFKRCSTVLVEKLRMSAIKGEPVEMKRNFNAYSMNVLTSCFFSIKIESNDPNNEFVLNGVRIAQKSIDYKYILYCLCPRLMGLFGILAWPREAIEFFKNVSLQILEERKRSGETKNDFLQLLINAANEQRGKDDVTTTRHDVRNYEEEKNERVKTNDPTKKFLNLDDLVAQCIAIFIAGFESPASTLACVMYYLALHTDVQDKLLQEVKEIMDECNGELTYEGVQKMKYMDNVISETLRLNPPLIRLKRVANIDYPLGDTGVVIPKGTQIMIPAFAIHRDPEHYPDPDVFNPDRFTPEERSKRHVYTFMPFGEGRRNCVAMRLALIELKVCLAYILHNFTIKRCSQTKVPLQYDGSKHSLQPIEVTILLEERSSQSLTTCFHE